MSFPQSKASSQNDLWIAAEGYNHPSLPDKIDVAKGRKTVHPLVQMKGEMGRFVLNDSVQWCSVINKLARWHLLLHTAHSFTARKVIRYHSLIVR